MKELLRMIFHIPEPDGHPKGDARFIFRRKKERQFLRNFLGGFVIACILLLSGAGIAVKQLHQEINEQTKNFHEFQVHTKEISDKLDIAYATIQDLVDRQREGYRFTAGNGWQLAQLSLHDKVNMTYFPHHILKDPRKTWFHKWLEENNFILREDL